MSKEQKEEVEHWESY